MLQIRNLQRIYEKRDETANMKSDAAATNENAVEIRLNALTAEMFLELYGAVGWEKPCAEQVERALRNTLASFTAFLEDKPIGMARLIGDGGMSFYIKDFAVLPDCQGIGAGRAILKSLHEYITEYIELGWAVSLELISTKEAESFYKKHGFEERPCDWDGPGMLKMIRKEHEKEK